MTLVYRGDNILRGFDEDVRNHLRAEMEKRGIKIITKNIVEGIEKVNGGLDVCLSDHGQVVVDKVMFATDWPLIQHGEALKQIEDLGLREESLNSLLYDNAARVFGF